jgi:hypothetical protein
VEHDGLGRNLDIADTGEFSVLLEGDDHAFFEDALFVFDATFQVAQTKMWEYITAGSEQSVDVLEFIGLSETHFYTRA